MASIIKLYEIVKLQNPTLIGGTPGLGLISNIVAAHIIRSLSAKKFGEINSPFFQDIALSTAEGSIRSPTVELFHCKSGGGSDLIILYGNTQALTSYGQYELCGKILDVAQDMGCKLVACSGGLGKESVADVPTVHCTATDLDVLDMLMKHGLRVVQGSIFGMSGVLPGLAKVRGIKGFCLLAETTGIRLDVAAAKAVMEKLDLILGLNVGLANFEKAVEDVDRDLRPLET